MKRQVVNISYEKSQYKVIHDDSVRDNPFKVYHLWSELTDSGRRPRRKLLAKYETLADCLYYLWDEVNQDSKIPTEGGIVKETLRRR